MRKFTLLASVSSLAIIVASTALAGDRKPKSAQNAYAYAAPVPAFSWTACYVGAQGGWGWGREHITQQRVNKSTGLVTTKTANLQTSGGVFGGQVGCDYEFSSFNIGTGSQPLHLVIGAKGNFLGADLRGTTPDPFNPTFNSLSVRTNWIGSAVGRVGLTGLVPKLLLYAQAGGAWVRDRYDLSNTSLTPLAGIYNVTWSGATYGGGFEYLLNRDWSLFAELNVFEFRGMKTLATGSGGGTCSFGPCFSYAAWVNAPRIETVTVGLNYRLPLPRGSP